MEQVWNIYKALIEEDREEHFAVFTDQDKANDAINRLRLRDADDDEVNWNLRPCSVNPTPDMLDLPKTLREMETGDFVKAAYIELCNNGEMYVPLWIAPSWLVHEIRARYSIGLDFVGRKITLVSAEELERRAQGRDDEADMGGFVESPHP